MRDVWDLLLTIFAVTGALCWLCMITLTIYFWMCKPKRSEE